MFDFLKKKVGSLTERFGKSVKEEPKSEEQRLEEIRDQDKRELKAEISKTTKIKHVFAKEVEISEKDVSGFLDEFELALLESDVEQGTAKSIVDGLKKGIVGKKVKKDRITEELKDELKKVLTEIMEAEKIDFFAEVEKKKPFVVLFLGPNGAGKTTTIAKIAKVLQERNKSVILAAADTFRAASIEQIEMHAEKLNLRVVKHQYGADPAAVAFDAIKAAEAKKIDVVLIDSAGRQETNRNLMEELKKIVRIAKPDLTLYVGEAFTGQALLQQAREFDEKIGLDGFILTKIDCDAKGGTAISLLHTLHKPVVFVGTGQEYSELQEFKPEFIIDRIVQ